MATAFGSGLETADQSGTTWSISTPSISAGQMCVLGFVAYAPTATAPTLTGTGWETTPRGHGEYGDWNTHVGFFLCPPVASFVNAGQVQIGWSGGAWGTAWTQVVGAGEFDTVLGSVSIDASGIATTRTLPNLTAATNDSLRFEVLATVLNREMSNPVLIEQTEATYHTGPTGGVGGGFGYKAVSSGSTTGDLWTFTDPDGGSAGTPSVGTVLIIKNAASVTNPTLSGDVYLPDENASSGPATPTLAPTVVAVNSDEVDFTPQGTVDPTADTLVINRATVVSGVVGAYSQVQTVPLTGVTYPIRHTGLAPNTTYRFTYHLSRSGVPSSNTSPATGDITTRRLLVYLYTDSTAVGVTGVDAQVFRSPTGGALAGESIGYKTGLQFDVTAVSGRARLQIDLGAQPSGTKLRNGNSVAAVARKNLPGGDQIWTRIATDSVVAEV